jgi:hypothetical protein
MFLRRTTPRRSTRLLLALMMSAGLVAATPGVASADTVTNRDAAKDMAKYSGDRFKAAPRYRINDVVSTRLTHSKKKVGAELSLARLQKAGDSMWYVSIIPSKGATLDAILFAGKGNWAGTLAVSGPRGEQVSCGKHKINYKKDVVRITLPRDCVGKGRSVRFRIGSMSVKNDDSFMDDAMRDRPLRNSDNNYGLSRRVFR